MKRFAAPAVLLLASGCFYSTGAAQNSAPLQCFLVRSTPAGIVKIEGALRQLAADNTLQFDVGNPVVILLSDSAEGTPLVVFNRVLGAVINGQDYLLLANYESATRNPVRLEPVLALASKEVSFTPCPPKSESFSPPTFYE